MNETGKACSRCGEFKSLGQFYKHRGQHETLCKCCKKKTRDARNTEPVSKVSASVFESKADDQVTSMAKLFLGRDEIESLPEIDESVFYPEQRLHALGLEVEDIADLVAFVRWNLDQKQKQSKKETDRG